MHEYGIACGIVDTVRDVARQNNAKKVLKVNVEIGELTFVNPEQLKFSFEAITSETELDGARLEIDSIPAKVSCSCGYLGDAAGFTCPKCGTPPKVLHGREIYVRNVEIEV